VTLGDLDLLALINWDKLSADFPHIDANFTVPPLSGEETGHALLWNLELEWELELSNLALVLVRAQIKQVKVNTMQNLITAVV